MIITLPIDAYVVESTTSASLPYITDFALRWSDAGGLIVYHPPASAWIKNICISGRVITVYYPSLVDEIKSVIFSFSQSDIINGKLVRTHNLNSEVIDVSVIDDENISVGINYNVINSNTVEIDFTAILITGVWKVLIEK
jgi:hypothetical protein